jgi:predicted Kef-type K+ transport protein
LVFVVGLGFTLKNILPIAVVSHLLRLFVTMSSGSISAVWLGLSFKHGIVGLRGKLSEPVATRGP